MGFSLGSILGGGASGFMGLGTGLLSKLGGGNQQGSQSATGTYTPYFSQQLQDIVSKAGALYGQPSSFNPAASDAAQGEVTKTLGGDYLNANPYLDATFNRGADAINARLNSDFASHGALNTGALVGATGSAYSNLANDIYGGNYQNERNRMMTAAGLAPGVDQGVLAGKNYDWQKLANYLGVVQGAGDGYGTQTGTTPMYRNRGAGILGGALQGGQLGFGIGGPVGAGIGAIAGGILGGS